MKPEWDYIFETAKSVQDFLKSKQLSDLIVENLMMILMELLENAVKYGKYDSSYPQIDYLIKCNSNSVEIIVKNPISGIDKNRINKLIELINRINNKDDPYEAYLERLNHMSSNKLDDGESGLGLLRISYEGRSILSVAKEDNIITVKALFML
jgi:hypothetical protein